MAQLQYVPTCTPQVGGKTFESKCPNSIPLPPVAVPWLLGPWKFTPVAPRVGTGGAVVREAPAGAMKGTFVAWLPSWCPSCDPICTCWAASAAKACCWSRRDCGRGSGAPVAPPSTDDGVPLVTGCRWCVCVCVCWKLLSNQVH